MIKRLTSTPRENILRIKRKLTGLKRRKRFIHRSESATYARDLSILLQDIKKSVSDPQEGLSLVMAFFKSDAGVFEQCDDSNGMVGDVFRFDARDLFVEYAARCSDQKKTADAVLKLNQQDNYGVRNYLIDCSSEYLSESVIRGMIEKLQELADEEMNEYNSSHYLWQIVSLSRQIRDAQLHEKTVLSLYDAVNPAAAIDIAEAYIESGDVQTAHSWLQKIPDNSVYESKCRELLIEIYRKQDDTVQLTGLLRQKLRAHRCRDYLNALLEVVGSDKQEEIIAEECRLISQSTLLNLSDIRFLLETGKSAEAETHLLKLADQLNGEYYPGLLDLVTVFESAEGYLPASLIYRSLLLSILKKASTKAYGHGARYLKKLEILADSISDWKGFESHNTFFERIRKAHGLKKSFWSKVDAAGGI